MKKALLSLLLVTSLAAQEEATFRTGTDLVVLHATVLDQSGQVVNALPSAAFRVFENDTLQQIKVFRQEDAPISLALVIDNSASMIEKRPQVEAAALALVRASNPDDETCVLNFNQRATLDQEFTSDQTQLAAGIKGREAQGETALRDAVELAIAHLRERGKMDKKVILLVTDGSDNISVAPVEAVIREAQRQGIQIYTLGLLSDDNPYEAKQGRTALTRLANETGAQAYFPASLDAITQVTTEVARLIRNQYTIAYTPTDTSNDGQFRRLRVTVSDPRATNIRTRSGYYLNRESATSVRSSH